MHTNREVEIAIARLDAAISEAAMAAPEVASRANKYFRCENLNLHLAITRATSARGEKYATPIRELATNPATTIPNSLLNDSRA